MTNSSTLEQILVWAHTPQGESGIDSHRIIALVAPEHAEAVVRAFYDGVLPPIWNHLDEATRLAITNLGIDYQDAVNGEVSVHVDELKKYAPDLLEG